MNLKKIHPGSNSSADTLMEWVQRGCADALQQKYLETATLGIFVDIDHPEHVLETYALTFTYPSSKDHMDILQARTLTGSNVQISLKTKGMTATTTAAAIGTGTFKQQIVKMIRTLCIMMQTLGPLPTKKYVSMHLTYYDELTPADYEPPGFTSTIFELGYLFKDPTFKHDFGSVQSAHHQISLAMETSVDSATVKREGELAVPKVEAEKMADNHSITINHTTQETIVPEAGPIDKKETANEKISCLCGDSDVKKHIGLMV